MLKKSQNWNVIEVRLNTPGRKWEDTPISYQLTVPPTRTQAAYVDTLVAFIARQEGQVARWNWSGLLQGHYIEP